VTSSDVNDALDAGEPWPVTHPHRPLVDADSAALLDQAIVDLTILRSPMGLGDCLADLHAMVSLLAQLQDWLPVTVDGARRQGYSWAEIADQLTTTPATARRRYGGHRNNSPEEDAK